MKFLILLVLLISPTAKAAECVDVIKLYSAVVQKLDTHHYEIITHERTQFQSHAVLETTKTQFNGPGIVHGIGVMDKGITTVHMQNGFDSSVRIYRECKGYAHVQFN